MTSTPTKRIFLLDTNVLLHDPYSLLGFEDSTVGIPAIVLEEIDKFKTEATDRGRNARETIRQLDGMRQKGSLKEGVKLDNGSVIKIIFVPKENTPVLPYIVADEDNAILLAAMWLKIQGWDVQFVSRDLNMRVKADALGIPSFDYLKTRVSEDKFYKGWIRIQVPAVQLKREIPQELEALAKEQELTINEFVLVESQHNPYNYRVFRYLGGGNFKPVHEPSIKWPLKSRNPQQLMALDLLFDDSIQFVTLFGPAGTGKTFLALLAGLHKVLIEDAYEKILISRPVVPLGRDIGYLPGTIEEKLRSWMLPIYDNMEFIVHSVHSGRHVEEVDHEQGKQRKKKKRHDMREGTGLRPLDELTHHGKLSLEAITYMRGRSIPYQFILIDEVQNLTPHEVKTLISRAGTGSKVVLAGDPYQIDSPYLDFSSNGLVVTSEKFKGQSLFGTVYLETSERSELSKLVGELM